MKLLLSIIGVSSIGASPILPAISNINNTQEVIPHENRELNPRATIINDRLPGGDLGTFVSKSAARRSLNLIIAASGYIVDVDEKYDGLFILTGDESKGYTGTSLYQYSLILTDITTKLPGGHLGEFSSKENARVELDKLITKSGFKVEVDDSEPYEFRITGIKEEGFTGTSKYTWDINLFDITDILEDKSIGSFREVNEALLFAQREVFKYGLMLNQINFTVQKITDNSGIILVSGNEENGFTGDIKWYFNTTKKDLYLVLFNEKAVLSSNNEVSSLKEINSILAKYNLTNETTVSKVTGVPYSFKVTSRGSNYGGWKQFYWINKN
ncbi:hypothetical protein [Spiroplasma sp. BIUS-1]|uniref:hypothetical protein n=1 Tax=Spiroplasma sp. BIUS-1 TaxID=216964 RepID=UPI001396F7AF|nr:hypothetical protein [Spiroplasma sp. BIUS-1]QHX36828.1 hypothetical protein SBIUS_v1c05750 [Spiroplasma sp. BIUS-1]